jgi:hypothetical protein
MEGVMARSDSQAWWSRLPPGIDVEGDIIIADVGAGATGVATGKNISQRVTALLGAPTPDDTRLIDDEINGVAAGLHALRDQLDTATMAMADFQLELLRAELTKTGDEETPSASTITKVGDWLLDNVAGIAESITGLFATPAVGKIVGKAGDIAVKWVRERFGKDEEAEAG